MNARTICWGLGVLLAGGAWGQVDTLWTRTFGGDQWEIGQKLALTENGDILLGGGTFSYGEEGEILLLKLNSDGDSLWSRIIPEATSCESLINLPNQDIAVFGYVQREGYWGPVVTLLDEGGESEWQRTYEFASHTWLHGAIRTNDGGYLLGGEGLVSGQIWLFRIDADGDSLWSRNYGTIHEEAELDTSETCYSLCQTSDNGFAMAGIRVWFDGISYPSDIVVYKVDEQGDSLWSTIVRVGVNWDMARQIIETEDHGLLVVGTASTRLINDILLTKLSHDGRIEWTRNYGTVNNDNGQSRAFGISIVSIANGGYLIGGQTYIGEWPLWQRRFSILRIDEIGDSLWSRFFIGNEQESFGDLIQCPDGGFLLTGNTAESRNEGEGDFWLVKTTPDPVSVRDFRSTLNPVTFILEPPFPNPFNSMVTIPFSFSPINRGATDETRIAIFDPLGKRIADLIPYNIRQYGGQGSIVWNANGYPAGSYLVRLESGSQSMTQSIRLVR